MTTFELWSLIIMGAQVVALAPTLAIGAYQLVMQRRELIGQRKVLEYEVYQRISQANADLLWKAAEDPRLDVVWEPLDEDRRRELDEAQTSQEFGAWHAMTTEERCCYRYTRSALELVEQAFEVSHLGIAATSSWEKWDDWVLLWASTRYFPYVFEDTEQRLLDSFSSHVRTVTAAVGSDES